ncbi:hypothetical protein NHQ30_008787 [Ciborinia camelliae]|nr:hypothetical protein NHQ30_008787 [Ciborinia camelliae]
MRMIKNESLIDDIVIAWIRKLNDMFAQQNKAFASYFEMGNLRCTRRYQFGWILRSFRGVFYFGIVGRMYPSVEFYEARDARGQPFTKDHIRTECMLLLTAGADTTGTTIGRNDGISYFQPN